MEKLVRLLDNFNRDLSPFAGETKYTIWDDSVELAKYLIGNDVKPVVHGQWLYDSGSGKYFCSACDECALSFKKDTLCGGDLYEVCLTDYCPNCGAKMDLE